MVDSDQLDFLLSSSAGDTLHDQNKTFWVSRPLFQERYALIYGNRLANALGARSGGSLPAQRRVFCHHGPE